MDTDKITTAQASRPRGRPRKSPVGHPRRQLKFRATPALAEQLAAAGRATGRSVSEEIEYRLEMTFAQEVWKRQVLAQIDDEIIELIGKGLLVMAKAGHVRFDDSDPLRGRQYVFSPTILPLVEESRARRAARRAARAAADLPEGESK
jgi:hypothetical protein